MKLKGEEKHYVKDRDKEITTSMHRSISATLEASWSAMITLLKIQELAVTVIDDKASIQSSANVVY